MAQSVQANCSVGILREHTGEDRVPKDVLPDLMGPLPFAKIGKLQAWSDVSVSALQTLLPV
jgi:hypothetical protein